MTDPIRSMLPDTIQLPMPDIREPFNESEMATAAEDLVALRSLEESEDKAKHSIDVKTTDDLKESVASASAGDNFVLEGKPMRVTRQRIDEVLKTIG